MKIKKRSKILAAAIAMMTFSTAAAVTGTVAWFTASNVVNVNGMSIQADTEQGIVIANETHEQPSDWGASAIASHTGEGYEFIPTSTYDASKWYHANSASFDDHTASGSYAELATSVNGSGTGVYKASVSNLDKNIYLVNSFFIKSSSTVISNQTLYINDFSVSGDSTSTDLDKSLRILVSYATNYKFLAPLETGTELVEYKVGGVETQKYTPVGKGVKNTVLATGVEVPANDTTNPLEIKVYAYFEGEDKNCKSSNIESDLDKLALSLRFGTEQVA